MERDLATGRDREVIGAGVANGPINLSPDGRMIVMGALPAAGGTATSLVLIPVAGGEPRTVFRSAHPPGRFANYQGLPWLPDGQGFLVRERIGSISEMWYVPLAGSPRKLDVDATPWATGPVGALSLHPDGRRLAFLLRSTRPTSEVWTLEHFLPRPTLAR
jgi:hypothetical protein